MLPTNKFPKDSELEAAIKPKLMVLRPKQIQDLDDENKWGKFFKKTIYAKVRSSTLIELYIDLLKKTNLTFSFKY